MVSEIRSSFKDGSSSSSLVREINILSSSPWFLAEMAKEIKDGYEITTKESGSATIIPVQPEPGAIPEPAPVDATNMTAGEFRRVVLNALGIKAI